MTLRHAAVLCLGILMTISNNMAQAANNTIGTLTMGDTVAITLEPDERVQYLVDIPVTTSFEIVSRGDDEVKWVYDLLREGKRDHSTMRGFHHDPVHDRLRISRDETYILAIENIDDVVGEVQFELTDVPTRQMQLDQRYLLEESDSPNIEYTFSLDESQAVVLESNVNRHGWPPDPFNYAMEHVTDTEIEQLVPFGEMGGDQFGMMLEPGYYRVVITNAFASIPPAMQSEDDKDEPPYFEVRTVTPIQESLNVGETIKLTAEVQPLQITYDLTAGQLFKANIHVEYIQSDGAHAYIVDESGDQMDYYGHGAVAHNHVAPSFVVPEDGTYTLHVFHPSMGEAANGNLTITGIVIDFPWIDTLEVNDTFDLSAGETRYLCNRIWEERTYRLTLATVDEQPIDGEVSVAVIRVSRDDRMPDETLLEAKTSDTAVSEFTFDAVESGRIITRIQAQKNTDTTLKFEFDYADDGYGHDRDC